MDLCPSATQYPDSCAPRDWDPQGWDPQGWGPQGWGPQGGDHHFGFKLASHLHKGVAIHVVQNGLERKASLQQSRCEISLLLYKANAFHILFGWAQVCSRWLQLAQVGSSWHSFVQVCHVASVLSRATGQCMHKKCFCGAPMLGNVSWWVLAMMDAQQWLA